MLALTFSHVIWHLFLSHAEGTCPLSLHFLSPVQPGWSLTCRRHMLDSCMSSDCLVSDHSLKLHGGALCLSLSYVRKCCHHSPLPVCLFLGASWAAFFPTPVGMCWLSNILTRPLACAPALGCRSAPRGGREMMLCDCWEGSGRSLSLLLVVRTCALGILAEGLDVSLLRDAGLVELPAEGTGPGVVSAPGPLLRTSLVRATWSR